MASVAVSHSTTIRQAAESIQIIMISRVSIGLPISKPGRSWGKAARITIATVASRNNPTESVAPGLMLLLFSYFCTSPFAGAQGRPRHPATHIPVGSNKSGDHRGSKRGGKTYRHHLNKTDTVYLHNSEHSRHCGADRRTGNRNLRSDNRTGKRAGRTDTGLFRHFSNHRQRGKTINPVPAIMVIDQV